jgi:hypothetical protein
MSLDKNLFTLLFTPHKDNQNVIDLVDPSGTVHYRKQRVPGSEYKIEVYGLFIILTRCCSGLHRLSCFRPHVGIVASHGNSTITCE